MEIKSTQDLNNPKMTAGPTTVDMAEISKKSQEAAAKREEMTIQGQQGGQPQGNLQPGNVNITA